MSDCGVCVCVCEDHMTRQIRRKCAFGKRQQKNFYGETVHQKFASPKGGRGTPATL